MQSLAVLAGISDQIADDPDWAYQRFDQAAFGLCVFAPLIMWLADVINNGVRWPRGSISAYHDLLPAGAFFIPLTVAVVLFIVNGWLIPGHRIHILMGLYALGVLLFDEKDATKPVHFFFAISFFFVGAFLELARHDSPDEWGPGTWVLMAPILPLWLLVRHADGLVSKWRSAVAILLPFPLIWLLGQVWPWLDERWLFFAEWAALIALITQYLRDVQAHAFDDHITGVENRSEHA